MTLTEMLLGPAGGYDFGVHTDGVLTTGRPWPVTLDLLRLTARRADLMGRVKPRE